MNYILFRKKMYKVRPISVFFCSRIGADPFFLDGHIYVIVLGGNSEIGVYVRINLCYLICIRHSIGSETVIHRKFVIRKDQFSSCVCNIF